MNFPKEKLLEVVKIVATAIVSIITTLFLSDCSLTLNAIRKSSDSCIENNQSTTATADSTNVNLDIK